MVIKRYSRIVIAAPQGRSGKTTVSLGICAALAARGLRVQPFKKGPDYIDPSWLSQAAGRACRSLDPFFLVDEAGMRRAFAKGAAGSELALIEGNHGLYDSSLTGNEDDEGAGSTASVARTLRAPVLLVVNAARMGRSAAAMVHGYQTFEPGTPIAGVVLNNVAQGRHEGKLRRAIEGSCGLPVVGAIPRDEELSIPDRHLGLIPHAEDQGLHPALERCRLAAEKYLDLEQVLAIAGQEPWGDDPEGRKQEDSSSPPLIPEGQTLVTIGILRDRAFTFYYPENLEALKEAGARLVSIDALQDPALPHVDALYFGGGFPEIFMEGLAANVGLREALRKAVEAGIPVYAECGGLMYLSQRIRWGERVAEMVGALPLEVEMTERPQGHGYVQAETMAKNPFLPVGATLRGHEFHHSRLLSRAACLLTAYRLSRGTGLGDSRDGIVYRNVLAAYTHLHAYGSPEWARGLVRAATGN